MDRRVVSNGVRKTDVRSFFRMAIMRPPTTTSIRNLRRAFSSPEPARPVIKTPLRGFHGNFRESKPAATQGDRTKDTIWQMLEGWMWCQVGCISQSVRCCSRNFRDLVPQARDRAAWLCLGSVFARVVGSSNECPICEWTEQERMSTFRRLATRGLRGSSCKRS